MSKLPESIEPIAKGKGKQTTVDYGHSHGFTVDEHGGGVTDSVDGHVHNIIKGCVQMANSHTHTLL